MPRVKQRFDDTCFKLALDCFDEMESLFSAASGKSDEKSKNLIEEARAIFKKHGFD